MAYYGFKDLSLFVGGYNVTGDVDNVSFKASAILDERTFAGTAWPTAIDTGQRRGEIGCSGVYNSVTGATPILANLSGTNQVVTLCDEGGTIGSRCWNLRTAMVREVGLGFDTEKVDDLTPAFAITGQCNRGYVVAALAARGAASNTDADAADGGASSTTTRAFLHVTAITPGGGNGVTVTPRSSSDAVTYAPCSASFTKTAVVTSESIALTGTVERYLSISWAWDGGAGQSFTAIVAVARD